MRFAVYLPPRRSKGERVPAVYFLAGLTCTEETFAVKAGAQRVAAELGLALVTCDTSPRTRGTRATTRSWDFGQGAGFYVDATEAPWSGRTMDVQLRDARAARRGGRASPSRASARRDGALHGRPRRAHPRAATPRARRRACRRWRPSWRRARCRGARRPSRATSGATGRRGAPTTPTELVKRASVFPGEVLIDQGTTDRFLDGVACSCSPSASRRPARRPGSRCQLRMRDGYDHSYYFIETFIEEHLRHHAKALLG
jgi:S-formylglutathione hydrolase